MLFDSSLPTSVYSLVRRDKFLLDQILDPLIIQRPLFVAVGASIPSYVLRPPSRSWEGKSSQLTRSGTVISLKTMK